MDVEQENTGMVIAILDVLLINAQYNDTQRWFAGLRKPSKLTMDLMKDKCNAYERNQSNG